MTHKKIYLVAMWMLMHSFVFGQQRDEARPAGKKINYYETENYKRFSPKLSLGVGVGFSNMFGDFSNSVAAPVVRLGFGCRLTTNFVIETEMYFGQLSSYENPISWSSTKFSETSNFESIDILAKITLGNYLQYPHGVFLKLLSGIYLGTGVGVVNNNITSFSGRFVKDQLNIMLDDGMFTKRSVITPFIPLNIGLRIPLKKFLGSVRTQFMINYQMNYTLSDYVDGYSFAGNTSNTRNQFKDCYTVLTFGLSFHISNN